MIDIKEMRVKKGMTQEQLSEVSGVKRTTIAMIETGKNVPSIATAKALAKVLGFAWADCYEVEEDEGGEEDASDGAGSRVEAASE